MDQSKSPVPSQSPRLIPEVLPVCPRCSAELKTIKHLDYGNVRIVYHDAEGCGNVLGAIKAE